MSTMPRYTSHHNNLAIGPLLMMWVLLPFSSASSETPVSVDMALLLVTGILCKQDPSIEFVIKHMTMDHLGLGGEITYRYWHWSQLGHVAIEASKGPVTIVFSLDPSLGNSILCHLIEIWILRHTMDWVELRFR